MALQACVHQRSLRVYQSMAFSSRDCLRSEPGVCCSLAWAWLALVHFCCVYTTEHRGVQGMAGVFSGQHCLQDHRGVLCELVWRRCRVWLVCLACNVVCWRRTRLYILTRHSYAMPLCVTGLGPVVSFASTHVQWLGTRVCTWLCVRCQRRIFVCAGICMCEVCILCARVYWMHTHTHTHTRACAVSLYANLSLVCAHAR